MKGLIDDSQEVFRKRRGTGSCIYKLRDNIQIVIEQKKVAFALFINLEKAFGSFWIDGLMYNFREAGINSYILNIIDHYLRNRSVYIENGANRSKNVKPKVGFLEEAMFLHFYLSTKLQTRSKNAKVKLESTPMMFQQVTQWKKFFCISKSIARKSQKELESGF